MKEIGSYWLDEMHEINYKIISVERGIYTDLIYYHIEYAKPIYTETLYRCSQEELKFDYNSTEDKFLLDKIQ